MLEIYQIITTVNAETFDLYAKNMGQRMLQHITDADMVVFNRATEETRQLIRDRNVRSIVVFVLILDALHDAVRLFEHIGFVLSATATCAA